MAITLDPVTKVFTVPQADLTFISGTLYEMDTEVQFRQTINTLMDDEARIWMDQPITHNTEITVAGTTFARFIEIINGYSVTFTPDSQWTVRFVGSNNNIFDVENGILNQNQVQVIPGNSAGLIAGGASVADFWGRLIDGYSAEALMRIFAAALAGKVSGGPNSPVFRDIADTKARITATTDANGNRTVVTVDST